MPDIEIPLDFFIPDPAAPVGIAGAPAKLMAEEAKLAPLEIREAADTVAPGSGTVAMGGSHGEMLYYVRGTSFHEAAQAILGDVRPAGDGRLKRTLPRCHPQLPRQFAFQVGHRGAGVEDEGVARTQFVAARNPDPKVPAVRDDYVRYADYDFAVSFETPPYAVLHDDDIDVLPGEWFDDNGDPRGFAYATEWRRFCDFPTEPTPEFVQARLGQMAFRTASGDAPHRYSMPNLIRMPWPKEMLRLQWFSVPWVYAQNPNFYPRKFLWRINQNPWLGYEPGQLLLEGYRFLKRQTPHFAGPDVLVAGPGDISSEKIVDVELHLRICRSEPEDAPVPANRNWIAAGHNLFPWAGDRRMHYPTATGVDKTKLIFDPADDLNPLRWVPTYRSAPFELLQTDPAIPQPDLGVFKV